MAPLEEAHMATATATPAVDPIIAIVGAKPNAGLLFFPVIVYHHESIISQRKEIHYSYGAQDHLV